MAWSREDVALVVCFGWIPWGLAWGGLGAVTGIDALVLIAAAPALLVGGAVVAMLVGLMWALAGAARRWWHAVLGGAG
jgi:hypothetical protein